MRVSVVFSAVLKVIARIFALPALLLVFIAEQIEDVADSLSK